MATTTVSSVPSGISAPLAYVTVGSLESTTAVMYSLPAPARPARSGDGGDRQPGAAQRRRRRVTSTARRRSSPSRAAGPTSARRSRRPSSPRCSPCVGVGDRRARGDQPDAGVGVDRGHERGRGGRIGPGRPRSERADPDPELGRRPGHGRREVEHAVPLLPAGGHVLPPAGLDGARPDLHVVHGVEDRDRRADGQPEPSTRPATRPTRRTCRRSAARPRRTGPCWANGGPAASTAPALPATAVPVTVVVAGATLEAGVDGVDDDGAWTRSTRSSRWSGPSTRRSSASSHRRSDSP